MEQGANGLGGLAVFADHLANVVAGHRELQHCTALSRRFGHPDIVGAIDQRAGQHEHELFHDRNNLTSLPGPRLLARGTS